MNTTEQLFAEETLILANRLLSDHFESPICLGEPQNNSGSNRARVYRCRILEGPDHVPASVIVKPQSDACPDNCLYANAVVSAGF